MLLIDQSFSFTDFTARSRILDVVYNSSNNELVRTKTVLKNAIVQVDATAFNAFYQKKYGKTVGKKVAGKKEEAGQQSNSVKRKIAARSAASELNPALKDQFVGGRLLACISSRPGQCGRADGYILEGKELEFYSKKLNAKKK